MNDEPWYGAKCIFLHAKGAGRSKQFYEERVVLIKAENFDKAVSRAEVMAEEYAKGLDGCAYAGFMNVFHIFDEQIGDGTEVYSLMRKSDLSKDEYLDKFYDTGAERSGGAEASSS
ncbi:DUF4288 domain-containing protein [Anatilimnocola floriformis]|uniref:DUF4288 domain-containing protein n=1 Tax=Anatilimnocola floriformis TaxID=2948575 RepID=UPI0020C4D6AB|nr:DUF4288 domain-containing protein [Anatilimnocola floriformis]